MPHVESILSILHGKEIQSVEVEKARLLRNSGRYLQYDGDYPEAKLRLEKPFDICNKYLDKRHIDTMESAGILGWVPASFEKSVGAQPLLEQLLKDRTEVLGEDDPRTIDCHSDYACALSLTGLGKSEKLQRDAYHRSLNILGPEATGTLDCMAHLAAVLKERQNFIEAERLFREVWRGKKNLFGHSHQEVLAAEHKSAYVLSELGDRDD